MAKAVNRFVIIIGDTRQMAIKAAPPPAVLATCADGAQKSKRLQTAKILPDQPKLIVPPEAWGGDWFEGVTR